ncbi:MAG: hypothetical protein ACHQFX_15255 [Chitinophagales bacterium]
MIPPALNTPQFTEIIETIKMLYRVDESFKTLCDDYVTSKIKIEELKELEIENKECEFHYKQLSVDLEKEILDYVDRIQ